MNGRTAWVRVLVVDPSTVDVAELIRMEPGRIIRAPELRYLDLDDGSWFALEEIIAGTSL